MPGGVCFRASVVGHPAESGGRRRRPASARRARHKIDALGSPVTCAASVRSLRWQGRHAQVGLLPTAAGDPVVPMSQVTGRELEIFGSHGMAAHDYPPMMDMVRAGILRPDLLVTSTIVLDAAPAALAAMGTAPGQG